MKYEYDSQLRKVAEKRDDIDSEYRFHKKRLEENDYKLLCNIKRVDEAASANPLISQDAKLQDIYAQRQSIYSVMRQKQMEFDEYLQQKYQEDMNKLDEEEKAIKASIDESNEKESDGGCE